MSLTLLREQEAFMLSRLRAAAALATFVALAVGGESFVGRADAAPPNLTTSTVLTPKSRQGTSLRAQPRMGAEVLGNVPHGTRFAVEEIQGLWIRVSAETVDASGARARKTGWVKAGDTADPYALTGPGRLGTSEATAQASPAAAGRGFGPDTEDGLRESNAQIAAAYPDVDGLERVKPTPNEVQVFAQQGRLGFPGRTR